MDARGASRPSSSLSIFGEVISEDFLSCKSCFRGLVEPRVLRCLHTYCTECLQKYTKLINPLRTVVECPVCATTTRLSGEGIQSLPYNSFVVRLGHQIIEDMTDGLPCDSCSFEGTEAIAEFRCINCKDYLCAECNRAHKKTRITRNHDIVELCSIKTILEEKKSISGITKQEENGLTDEDTGKDEQWCANHPDKEVTVHDENCEQLLCDKCGRSEEHSGHRIEPISRAARISRQKILLVLPELERSFPGINTCIDNTEVAISQCTVSNDKLKEEIKARAEMIREAVTHSEEELLRQIAVISKESDRSLKKATRDTKHLQASFVVAFQFAHQLLSHGTDLEVMLLKGVCLERLKQLQSIRITESIQTTQAHLHTTNNIDFNSLVGRLETTRKIARPVQLEQHSLGLNAHQEWVSGMAQNATTGELCFAIASIREGKSRIVLYSKKKKLTSFHTNQLAGLCLTREGNIVTADKTDCRVKMYTATGQLIRSFKCLSTGGVVITGEGLIQVAGSTAVQTYRRNGELMGTIGDRSVGRRNDMSVRKQLTINQLTGDLIVSDACDGRVRVYMPNGHPLFTYGTDGHDRDQLSCPQGVCSDKSGNILIADRNNHRIHMISEQGNFRSFAVTAEDGLSSPAYVCVNRDGYLLVAEHTGLVKTFQYL